jgi:hypothetical protein
LKTYQNREKQRITEMNRNKQTKTYENLISIILLFLVVVKKKKTEKKKKGMRCWMCLGKMID